MNLILPHLEPLELVFCFRVNKRWRTLASKDTLWEKLSPVDLSKHGIRSKEMLEKRLKKFVENAPWNQKHKFHCAFLCNRFAFINLTFIHYHLSTPDIDRIRFGEDCLVDKCYLVERLPGQILLDHTKKRWKPESYCIENTNSGGGPYDRGNYDANYDVKTCYLLPVENKEWAEKLCKTVITSVLNEKQYKEFYHQRKIARRSRRNNLLIGAVVIMAVVNVILYQLSIKR